MIVEKTVIISGIEYIVSSDGRIYSTKNIGRGKFHREITQRPNKDGYMCVTVGKNNSRKCKTVHRIIAEAFVPNPDNLPEVDHIDNNKINNDYSNLQWISGFDNKSKIPFNVRSKSHKRELNGRAKLSVSDVAEIRKLFEMGVPKYKIAKEFNCGWSTVHNIIIKNTWN